MSHINNIEIKNFKSIRHAKIEDCRRVNVFIGYPNVGKSNILEAISLLAILRNRSSISLKQLVRYKELIDIFSDGQREKKAEINADDFLVSLDYGNKNSLDIFVKDQDIKKRKVAITTPETAAGIFEGLDMRFSMNKEGLLTYNGGQNSNNYDVFNVKKYQFESSTFDVQRDPTVLSFPYGTNLAEVIRHNSSLRKECGELFSTYNLKLVFDENNQINIQKPLDEFSAFQFSISQVADTIQRLIFHKAATASNRDCVLLFEEPEAHMFPPYIAKFTADVNYDENKNQFFITTHSPFVLNDFMEDLDKDDYTFYAVGYKKELGETVIKRITEEEIQKIYQYGIDLFFNLENFLQDAV